MDEEGSPGPCKLCPVGRYITDNKLSEMHNSSDSCIVCQAGAYAENKGSNECTKCQRGKYLQDSSNDESEHARAQMERDAEAMWVQMQGEVEEVRTQMERTGGHALAGAQCAGTSHLRRTRVHPSNAPPCPAA